MQTVVKGIYKNGKITLEKKPSLKNQVEVIVSFLDEKNPGNGNQKKKRKLGALKGKVTIPDDFNEPLGELNEYMF